MATETTLPVTVTPVVPVAKPVVKLTSFESKPKDSADQTRPEESARKKLSDLPAVVSEVSGMVQAVRRDLNFRLDDATGYTVVKVIDTGSQEVIRQIPSEEFLVVAQRLRALSETSSPSSEDIKGLLMVARA